jgi:DNA gyrase/topoisomerase IV subunit B
MKICNEHGLSYHSLKGDDIEVAITHSKSQYSEEYSFVNGQNTTQGGTFSSF